MWFRTLTPWVLVISSVAGCADWTTPSQQEAIDVIRRLGGRLEPEQPTLTRPVFRVSLTDTNATDQHLRYLGAFPALRLLSLKNTPVTDNGLVHLKRARMLRRTDLSGTNVSDAGVTDLRRTLPGLQVRR